MTALQLEWSLERLCEPYGRSGWKADIADFPVQSTHIETSNLQRKVLQSVGAVSPVTSRALVPERHGTLPARGAPQCMHSSSKTNP